MGMSYELYWYGDVWAVVDFRKADKIRLDGKNQELWLQGMYIYEAISDIAPILVASPKKGAQPKRYSKKPYDLHGCEDGQEQQEKEKQEEQETLFAKAYMQNMVFTGKSWSK